MLSNARGSRIVLHPIYSVERVFSGVQENERLAERASNQGLVGQGGNSVEKGGVIVREDGLGSSEKVKLIRCPWHKNQSLGRRV